MQALLELSLKAKFLRALIASVTVSALVGIGVVLFGEFGDLEMRILLTSLTIAGVSLCGVSCGAVLESQRGHRLAGAGIALSLIAGVLLIVGIWSKTNSEVFWKTAVTTSVFAIACTHTALLGLSRLAPNYAWAMWAAHGAIFGVASILSVMLWGEIDGEPIFRLLGVVAILDGAITILIPVFHRLSRPDLPDAETLPVEPTLEEIDRELDELRHRVETLERRRERIASARLDNSSRSTDVFADAN